MSSAQADIALRASRERWRLLVVDTAAMIVFCTVTGMMVEVGISGLTWTQSAQARLAAIPLNLLTARPYGVYRDWLFHKLGAHQGGRLRVTGVDVLCFVTFQVPVYAAVLLAAGATLQQLVASCTTMTLLSAFMGRPYGAFLELCRRLGKAGETRSCS